MNYETGVVYVWQNQTEYPFLNGSETVVTGPFTHFYDTQGKVSFGWPTDTPSPISGKWTFFAEAGDLRRKQPPSGELSILKMFVVVPPQRTKEIA